MRESKQVSAFHGQGLNRITLAVAMAISFAGDVRATVTIPLPITNPGAESGSLAGWTNSAGNFSAVNDSLAARNGDWYFEAPAAPAGNGAELWQMIDVRQYQGMIEYPILEVSMAADAGEATVFGPGFSGDYVFTAITWLRFFDINGIPIPFATGAFIVGEPSLAWVDRVTNLEFIGTLHPEYFSSLGYILIELSGDWWNTTTDTFLHGSVPDTFHTITPTTVRFDDIRLSIVVPEPATMVLLAVGGLITIRRRTARA